MLFFDTAVIDVLVFPTGPSGAGLCPPRLCHLALFWFVDQNEESELGAGDSRFHCVCGRDPSCDSNGSLVSASWALRTLSTLRVSFQLENAQIPGWSSYPHKKGVSRTPFKVVDADT